MAVLGWIALGLVTAVLASGVRRAEESRGVLVGRYAAGIVGAVLGGLVAVAVGVGPIGDIFHSAVWLIALGGAMLAIVVYELARTSRGRREIAGPQNRSGAGRADGESETLDRDW